MSREQAWNWGKLASAAVFFTALGALFLYLAEFVPIPRQVADHEKRITALEFNTAFITNQLFWIRKDIERHPVLSPKEEQLDQSGSPLTPTLFPNGGEGDHGSSPARTGAPQRAATLLVLAGATNNTANP